MWKPEHRRAADRTDLRYLSDLSDGEWLIVEPMIPPAKRGGRRRSVNVREVLNGIFYILWTGWFMPKDSSGACDCDHYVTKKCAPGDDRVNPESSNRDTPLHRQRQAERDGALR